MGQTNIHAIVSSGLVRIAQLGVRVTINTDVKSKGVDTETLGALHVSIVVGCAGAICDNANLQGDGSGSTDDHNLEDNRKSVLTMKWQNTSLSPTLARLARVSSGRARPYAESADASRPNRDLANIVR